MYKYNGKKFKSDGQLRSAISKDIRKYANKDLIKQKAALGALRDSYSKSSGFKRTCIQNEIVRVTLAVDLSEAATRVAVS